MKDTVMVRLNVQELLLLTALLNASVPIHLRDDDCMHCHAVMAFKGHISDLPGGKVVLDEVKSTDPYGLFARFHALVRQIAPVYSHAFEDNAGDA